MTRIKSLAILLEQEGKDYLAELYGKVIENVEKGTISSLLKNTDLSGNPISGTVEAKRFAFAQSETYGTARREGKGNKLVARPVTVPIDQDKEIVSELEMKDTTLYGVDSLLARRSTEHSASMIRQLEKVFFAKAASEATAITGSSPTATAQELFEEEVLAIETMQNEFVDGVPRSMIHIVKTPAEYSKLRQWINVAPHNPNITTNVEEFGTLNGVKVYSSIDLPRGVNTIAMCVGSIAQPVLPKGYEAEKIPLSNAYALELFYSYGTEAVMPELIFKRTDVPPTAVSGVTLDENVITIATGGTDTLTATIAPVGAANKNVVWASSDEAVATVAPTANPLVATVTAVGEGTAIITATTKDGGYVDDCTVIIADSVVGVTGVSLDENVVTLTSAAQQKTLTATIAPAGATNKAVVWASSDTTKAVVDMTVDSGNQLKVTIEAVANGTATITATTEDGGYVDDCTVIVDIA